MKNGRNCSACEVYNDKKEQLNKERDMVNLLNSSFKSAFIVSNENPEGEWVQTEEIRYYNLNE